VSGPWPVPTPKLPPPRWDTRNPADVDAMAAWVSEHLEVRQAERFNQLYAELKAHGGVEIEENGPARVVRYSDAEALEEARLGNMEPLHEAARRAGHPEWVPFLQPKRGRGQYKRVRYYTLEEAVEDVYFIRQLWQQEYGRSRRARGNRPTAEEIAAAFHNVDVRGVISRTKNYRR